MAVANETFRIVVACRNATVSVMSSQRSRGLRSGGHATDVVQQRLAGSTMAEILRFSVFSVSLFEVRFLAGSALPRITVRRMLKSNAMRPASRPRLSSYCFSRICASSWALNTRSRRCLIPVSARVATIMSAGFCVRSF